MWIITNKGFLSIVAKGRNGKPSGKGPHAIVSVRFRRKEDAAKLFPNHKRVDTPGGDYGCRIFATRQEVADMLAASALGLDYTNFKSSIPKTDNLLHDVCMAAWSVFGRLQPGGPYGRDYHRAPPADWQDYGRQPSLPLTGARHAAGKPGVVDWCDGCGRVVGAADLDDDQLCKDCAGNEAWTDDDLRNFVDSYMDPEQEGSGGDGGSDPEPA